MDLGLAIKTLRLKNNMTQGQLAAKCFVSTNTVCSWETCTKYPPKGALERVCKAFDVPVSYLVLSALSEDDFPKEKRVLCKALIESLCNELLDSNRP